MLATKRTVIGQMIVCQGCCCGCVGPCDVPNVVVVNSETGSKWLGHITQFNQYRSLVDWAVHCVEAGHLIELPREFKDHLMEPWR